MSNFHTLEDLSRSSQTQVQLGKKILDLGIVNARENLFYQIWLTTSLPGRSACQDPGILV